MKKTGQHLILLYTLLLALGVYFFVTRQRVPKTAYLNTIELYNSFEMKQELEKKLTASQNARKAILDSLLFNLKMLNNRLQAASKDQALINELTMQKQNYLEREQLFKEDNERQSADYNNQIWTQLNQYIKDYGSKNNYDYIFGADGSGSLMYAGDAMEITSELKEFVNQQYGGKK